MNRTTIAAAALIAGLLLAAAAPNPSPGPDEAVSLESSKTQGGFLYARITTKNGETYEGRIRFGGNEEAFWSEYFNGVKARNTWADHVPPERLKVRYPLEVFGMTLTLLERRIDLERPFMARFGDIVRIDAQLRTISVTLKSGTVVKLDRFSADDLADGVRVWDRQRGVIDLDEWQIRRIEFFPSPELDAPARLYGTVSTTEGAFTGFIQWNREQGVGTDLLSGQYDDDDHDLRFDTIRSVGRDDNDIAVVTLLDGRQIERSGTHQGNRGLYVNDPRYGRVLVSWRAFERVDFRSQDSGPCYGDFLPGRPLTGRVTTRTGSRIDGRLVFDLDESEDTESLDAPSGGVDYSIPFGLIASILPTGLGDGRATVMLQSGEELQLQRAGDLADHNAGTLIFVDGRVSPEYVSWSEIERIDFTPSIR